MPRGNQLIRQWSILNLIEAYHYGITIENLAHEVGCTTRTIRRDLEVLELAGFPLYNDTIDGETRWMVTSEFRKSLNIPFTITELLSLYFSRDLLRVLKDTPFYDSIESLFSKIRKTISPKTLEHLKKLEQSFYAGQKKQREYGSFKEYLDKLMDATANGRTVEMKYHSMHSDKTTVRKIDPYKIWYFDNTFFLIGKCHRHKEVRMFVVDRIKDLNITNETFQIPSDFSLEDYMKDSFGVIHDKKVKVVIQFDQEVARYIRERIWHPSQRIKENKDESITISLNVAGTNEVKYWVLSYGPCAEVLEPKTLRDEIKHDLSLALRRY